MSGKRDDLKQRVLACMQRAPGGTYTAVQLSRNTGLSVAEVQQGLANLEQESAIVRAAHLSYPAYCLTGRQSAPVGHMTPREAADRTRQPAA